MKLSTKTRYGTRILVELAQKKDQGAIQVSKIASSTKIPVKYMEQLLRALKQAGLVKTIRGAKGGHILVENPDPNDDIFKKGLSSPGYLVIPLVNKINKKCWESKSCTKTACPAHGSVNPYCWSIPGSGLLIDAESEDERRAADHLGEAPEQGRRRTKLPSARRFGTHRQRRLRRRLRDLCRDLR